MISLKCFSVFHLLQFPLNLVYSYTFIFIFYFSKRIINSSSFFPGDLSMLQCGTDGARKKKNFNVLVKVIGTTCTLFFFFWQVGDGWVQEKQYVFRNLNCCIMRYIKQTPAPHLHRQTGLPGNYFRSVPVYFTSSFKGLLTLMSFQTHMTFFSGGEKTAECLSCFLLYTESGW